eukprot:g25107.t1
MLLLARHGCASFFATAVVLQNFCCPFQALTRSRTKNSSGSGRDGRAQRSAAGLLHIGGAASSASSSLASSAAIVSLDESLRSLTVLVAGLVPHMQPGARLLTWSSDLAFASPSTWTTTHGGMAALASAFVEQYTQALAHQLRHSCTVYGLRLTEEALRIALDPALDPDMRSKLEPRQKIELRSMSFAMALTGALAAIKGPLSAEHRKEVLRFYNDEQLWLRNQLEALGFETFAAFAPFFMLRGPKAAFDAAVQAGAAIQAFSFAGESDFQRSPAVCLVADRASNQSTIRMLKTALEETGLPDWAQMLKPMFIEPDDREDWTCGCKLSILREMVDADFRPLEVEASPWWEVGGTKTYSCARPVFYDALDAVLLVYDMSNMKSYHGLVAWLFELCSLVRPPSLKYWDAGGGSGGQPDMDLELGDSRSSEQGILGGRCPDQQQRENFARNKPRPIPPERPPLVDRLLGGGTGDAFLQPYRRSTAEQQLLEKLCDFANASAANAISKLLSLKRRELTEVERKAHNYELVADQKQQEVQELQERLAAQAALASQKEEEMERLRQEVEAEKNKVSFLNPSS